MERKLNHANFAPGQTLQVVLKLHYPDDLTQYWRPCSAWVPWSVLASGTALATGSTLLNLNRLRAS